MPKVSPHAIRRPARSSFDVHLVDPPREGYDGVTVTLRLRPLTAVEWIAANDFALRMIERHVNGRGEPEMPGYVPPEPFPPLDGEPVYVSETTCRILAGLVLAQVPTENAASPDERYTFEELAMFAQANGIARGIAEAYAQLQRETERTTGPLA